MSITMTVTNAGHNLLRDGLQGANTPLITYVAIGSGTTAPAVTDTQLVAETFRKAVTSYANGASAGEVLITLYLAPAEAVGGNIEEVGFFGGSTASGTANTGVLLARGLYVHNPKTSIESIQLQLDFTC